MAGFTLGERETTRLRELVDGFREVGEEPIPWPVLEGLSGLLHTDALTLGGYCTAPAHLWFLNEIGRGERWTETETPDQARSNPFWQHYWQATCSYPDRSGDYDSVTLESDFLSLREIRRLGRAGEMPPFEREIMAPLRLGPTRQLRVVGWRTTGSDFTDRDRFYLTLLRPHIHDHYRRWLQSHPPSTGLTRRQLAVLSLVRDGFTNQQVGRRLGLSEGTVRTHLNHVYERLGVASRTAAVTAVYGNGAP